MSQENVAPTAILSEAEMQAIRTLYRAFTDKNLGLLDEAVTPDWQDIPLAPGQGPGPERWKDHSYLAS